MIATITIDPKTTQSTSQRCTAKQFAAFVLDTDLDSVIGYWSERWPEEYAKMSDSERKAVTAQLLAYADRIYKMIERSVPRAALKEAGAL